MATSLPKRISKLEHLQCGRRQIHAHIHRVGNKNMPTIWRIHWGRIQNEFLMSG